jgi:dTDP-4-dehydrorhamnose 3,5-epimerase-like enzyme
MTKLQSVPFSIKDVQKTTIDGLEWHPNYFTTFDNDAYYIIETREGGIVEILFYANAQKATWFGVHTGQRDQLTFFGDPRARIHGTFLDCRKDSPTLHRKQKLSFKPDPTKHLFIDRGIAHAFSFPRNITVRVEPIWFMAENNEDYDLVNDHLSFRIDENPSNYPKLTINTLPVPDEVLRYVLTEQQKAILEGRTKGFSMRTLLRGEVKRITVKRKQRN